MWVRGGAAAGENRTDFGHGGRWRRICVVSLLEASLLQLSFSRPHCSGETLDLGLLDRTMAVRGAVFPPGGIVFLEHVLAGGVLRWSGVVFRVEVGESRRRGVAGSR